MWRMKGHWTDLPVLGLSCLLHSLGLIVPTPPYKVLGSYRGQMGDGWRT